MSKELENDVKKKVSGGKRRNYYGTYPLMDASASSEANGVKQCCPNCGYSFGTHYGKRELGKMEWCPKCNEMVLVSTYDEHK